MSDISSVRCAEEVYSYRMVLRLTGFAGWKSARLVLCVISISAGDPILEDRGFLSQGIACLTLAYFKVISSNDCVDSPDATHPTSVDLTWTDS